MSHHPPDLSRLARSVAAISVLFVAVPVGLATAAQTRLGDRNPLSDVDPPWSWDTDSMSAALREPLRDDAVVDVLIRASLVTIWLALAAIATSIVIEVVHMRRHRGMPAPRVRGLGWAQRVGRWVAIGIVSIIPAASTSTTVVALDAAGTGPHMTLRVPTTVVSDEAGRSPVDPTLRGGPPSIRHASPEGALPVSQEPTPRPPAPATYLVERGDSVYGIAATLGPGNERQTIEVAEQILDLNLGREMNDGRRFTNPALIQPGWHLLVPGDVDERGADRSHAVVHEVERGETLSAIAAERLGDADAWPAIWQENRGNAMEGGRTFDDPDVILPGWKIVVPIGDEHLGDDASRTDAAPDDSPIVDAPAGDPPDDHRPIDIAGVDDVAQGGADDPDDAAVTDVAELPDDRGTVESRESSHEPQPPAETTVTSTVAPIDADAGAVEPAERGSAPRAPSPIKIEHAALLAAGVLTLAAVRRRRALRAALPHARVPSPPPEVAETERRLRSIDPGERAARVDVATRAIAHRLVGTAVQIAMIRAAPDGELDIVLTGPAALSAPWSAGSEVTSTTWTLPASVPIELLADDARRAGQPCLALVTIGVDDVGRDVLVDLEANGVTTIEAQPDQADDVLRAIASGLATSLASEVIHLVVAALGADCLFDHPNTHAAVNVTEAVATAVALAGSTAANDRTSFELRTRRTGGEMWEPAVLLLAGDDRVAASDLAGLPAPGHGVAAVLVSEPGGQPEARGRLRAGPDGWTLEVCGQVVDLRPIGLSTTDVADLADVLADAEVPAEPPSLMPCPHVVVDSGDDRTFTSTPHEIIVSLLGGVRITDRSGHVGAFERSKTVELIAWLATHRDHATRTSARTALWELDVRDATFANVVSEARRGLGRLVAPPEGEEWLARTLNESLPLHPLVITDVDLVRQRVDHARLAAPAHAIDVLRPAVAMIGGLPFAGTSYLWPDADGLTSNLVLLATTATAELAAHALSIGDTDLVFWATGHGLGVLPGHEELIGLRMRAHARAGDLAGVRQEWESYERVITADSWSDGEPAPKLLDLRRELLSPGTAQSG